MGILLASQFWFGKDGTQSGELAACCDPPVFAASCKKISSLQVATRPPYSQVTFCAEEESDERDTGGKGSCTQIGLCTVAPVG